MYKGPCDSQQGGQAMSPAHASTTVDTWPEWFATEKQAACRAYLCTRYDLNAVDAEALINAAQIHAFSTGLLSKIRWLTFGRCSSMLSPSRSVSAVANRGN
jgi:hypothetical protein